MIKNSGLSVKVNAFQYYELEKVKKYSSHTKYAYRPIYPGTGTYDGKNIERKTRWSCEMGEREKRYFEVETILMNDNIIC